MEFKDRTKTILETAVHDFILHGRPITSEYLYDEYDFGIKPAMIRWELNELNEDGFFYQTHPSGGRFPTKKAYRFLVESILEDEKQNALPKGLQGLVEGFIDGERKSFIQGMARQLKVLGIGYESQGHALYESGLRDLLENLPFAGKDELMEVVKDFDGLEVRLNENRGWWEREEIWPQVFIGESPITKSEHLSVIADRFDEGRGSFLLIAIGPTRTDYGKSLSMFQKLKKESKRKK